MNYEERNKEIMNVVDAMMASYDEFPDIIRIGKRIHIDAKVIADMLDSLRGLMFPGFFDNGNICEYTKAYYIRDILAEVRHNLKVQIERAMCHANDGKDIGDCGERLLNAISEIDPEERRNASIEAAKVTDAFLNRLPEIRRKLADDVDASFDGDPASNSISEIILSYPGIYAILVHRLAHELFLLEVPLIPRLMSEHAHSKTGIDIHPGATIGNHFFLDHGTGIVIGETARIGNNVKIYQGVTLGAHSTRGGRKLSGNKRHPDIEDDVTIYSGASILGGDTVIGEGSVIGSNAFITRSVPKGSRITGAE